MKWVRSAGGPLICVERDLVSSWCGILGNSVNTPPSKAALNDYERACSVSDYLGIVEVANKCALILGDMPLETTVCYLSPESLLLVRVFYIDPNVDLLQLLKSQSNIIFDEPIESIAFEIESGQMIIFDSAALGVRLGEESLSFDLPPGHYQILTQVFEPDSRTSLLVHKFVPEVTED